MANNARRSKRKNAWMIFHSATNEVKEKVHSKYALKRRLAYWNNKASEDAGEDYAPYSFRPAYGKEA